jgi:hypothetical protein
LLTRLIGGRRSACKSGVGPVLVEQVKELRRRPRPTCSSSLPSDADDNDVTVLAVRLR